MEEPRTATNEEWDAMLAAEIESRRQSLLNDPIIEQRAASAIPPYSRCVQISPSYPAEVMERYDRAARLY